MRQAFYNYINITENIININWTQMDEGWQTVWLLNACWQYLYWQTPRRQSVAKTLLKLNGTIKQIYMHKYDIIFPGTDRKKSKQTTYFPSTFLSIIWTRYDGSIETRFYKFGKIDVVLCECIISQHPYCVPPFINEYHPPFLAYNIFGTYK